jgi:hypothetical protein
VAPIAPIYGSESRTDVVPEFYRVTKSYVGPESETATGPNFVRRYRLEVDIPTGQTLTNLRVFDTLASSMQIVGQNTTAVSGRRIAPTGASSFRGRRGRSSFTPSCAKNSGTHTRAMTLREVDIKRDAFHGDWNYEIRRRQLG